MRDRVTMLQIRQAYPFPIKYPKLYAITEHDYCVLGACMLFTNHTGGTLDSTHFPEPLEMGEILRELNPQLTEAEAEYFAKQIAFENDQDHIEEAWMLLGSALLVKE